MFTHPMNYDGQSTGFTKKLELEEGLFITIVGVGTLISVVRLYTMAGQLRVEA